MSNPTPHTRNVTRLFRTATPAQVAQGMDWYTDAYRVADALAVKHGVSIQTSAGVIAALSPMQSWGANVNLAARLMDAGALHSGYLSVGLRKANAIMAGAEPLATLGSDKVSAFYECIVTRGETDTVCIDRHAHDIVTNTRMSDATRPRFKGARYAALALPYVKAARILSAEVGMRLYGAQVQAVTWVAWRHMFWSEGAFDGHNVKA